MTHVLEETYKILCEEVSDINEHLPTLYNYAKECNHITECGVRTVVSSYAFASAHINNPDSKLILVDPEKHPENIDNFLNECSNANVNAIFYEHSDLTCPIEDTDLLFIDTWHIYGQLKRELALWNAHVRKYIIMHDTTVDEWLGESVRCGYPILLQSQHFGFPVEEIVKGLWPAIDEFLKEHPEWKIKERFTNNNGLTILERQESV